MSLEKKLTGIAICPVCKRNLRKVPQDAIFGFNGRFAHFSCLRQTLRKYDIILPESKPDWLIDAETACEFFFTLVQIYDVVYQEDVNRWKSKRSAANIFRSIFAYFAWKSSQAEVPPMADFCLICGSFTHGSEEALVKGDESVIHYDCVKLYLAAHGITLPEAAPDFQEEKEWQEYLIDRLKSDAMENVHGGKRDNNLRFIAIKGLFDKLNWGAIDLTEIYNGIIK